MLGHTSVPGMKPVLGVLAIFLAAFLLQGCAKTAYNQGSEPGIQAQGEPDVLPQDTTGAGLDNGDGAGATGLGTNTCKDDDTDRASNTSRNHNHESGDMCKEEDHDEEGQCGHEDEGDHYRDLCTKAKSQGANIVKVAEEGTVSGLHGQKWISAGNLALVSNVTGKTRIFGTAVNGRITKLQGSRGKVIVCNMSITDVEDHRGTLIVVDGNIGNLTNVHGNVRLVGGKVTGVVKDSTSNVRETK